MIVVNIVLYILLGYLLISSLYYLFFGFTALIPRQYRQIRAAKDRKFAVLIPGYKEDAVIVDVAREALKQNYDQSLYDVIVIADSFKEETLLRLKELPIKLIEVSFEKSTKSKALNAAMKAIGDNYDVALVLDADNIMASDFLTVMNDAFNRGYVAVQGRRVPKNLNTSFAILDGISEEIGNTLFRKGHRAAGFSSALAGSGMAFDYAYFKQTMSEVHAVGGFDKELEMRIMRDKNRIEYRPDAIVFDEKVQKAEVFYNQRRRWLSTQSTYLLMAGKDALIALFTKGNIDYFNKVFQWFLLPKALLLGIAVVLSAIIMTFMPFGIIWMMAATLLASTILFYFLGIPGKYYNAKTLKAALTVPQAFGLMVLALLKLKGANKQFIHTDHSSTEGELKS